MSHSHNHNHNHVHDTHVHDENHDYAEANRAHFDKEAESHDDDPAPVIEMSKRLRPAVLQAYPFDEDKTTVLDYACARGSMSKQLMAYSKSIVGVDISQGMVDVYNLHAHNQGLAPEEMKAVRAELKGEDGELDGQKFDVVLCSMAYHHFSDINRVTVVLTHFLNPGGMLIVIDIKHRDPDDEDKLFEEKYHHVVPHHHGITEEVLRTAFEGAGLDKFETKDVTSTKSMGKDITLFIATGVKKL